MGHSEQDSFKPDKHQKKCPRRKGRNGHFQIALRKAKTMKIELSLENVQEMNGTIAVKNCNSGNKYTVAFVTVSHKPVRIRKQGMGSIPGMQTHHLCIPELSAIQMKKAISFSRSH